MSDPPHRYLHAWIEDNGYVYDWQTMEAGHGGVYRGRGFPRDVFYELFQPEDTVRYSWEQALANLVRHGHHGPWDERLVEFAGEVEPNPGTTYPWDGFVYPLAEQEDHVIKQLVGRDIELFQEAQNDPNRAALQVRSEGLLFRTGRPRIGEPLFRNELDIRFDHPSMNCGRGTGHLGTGLYFFGTLSAATGSFERRSRDWPTDPDAMREAVRGVYVVDISEVPRDRIHVPPDSEATTDLHGFGKAMLCWPYHYERYHKLKAELEEAQQRVRELQSEDEALTDKLLDEGWSMRQILRHDSHEQLSADQFKAEERAKELESYVRQAKGDARMDVRKMKQQGPKLYSSSVYLDEDDTERYLTEPPPEVRPAIDAYLRDLEHPYIPGYHPMTYYMTQMGYQMVVHGSWIQLNSGDIGNIWYPFEVDDA